MKKLEKSEIYGGIGSTILLILLLLLLFIFEIKYIITKENPPELALAEIEEAFNSGGGRGSEGKSGYFKPESAEVLKNSQPAAPKTAPTPPAPNFAAQDIEQNIAIQRARDEQRKKDEADAALLRLQQEEEQKRQKKTDDAQKNVAKYDWNNSNNSGDGGKGDKLGNGNGTGNGNVSGAGSGQNGNPFGKGNGGQSISANLSGRDLLTLDKPTFPISEEGILTINIKVDKDGNVLSATMGTPSEIQDSRQIEFARQDALKRKFTKGENDAWGKLVYKFSFKK